MESSLLFYELIQVALGNEDKLSRNPSEREWNVLYAISQKQAVSALAFLSLDKLNSVGQSIPKSLLYEWIGAAEMIRRQNLIVNERCRQITRFFIDKGYQSCILKGQGNAQMYPVPESRTSGDIDIWVFGERDEITRIVKEKFPDSFEQYHHIDFPVFDDVPVEVHYIAGSLIRPKYNKRFLEWCEDEKDKFVKGDGIKYNSLLGFAVPSVEFNAIFQMAHIFTHFFIEGIGLRHFVDYYYVLIKIQDSGFRFQVVQDIQWLGMEKFAKGVMWIEKECLGIEERHLLLEPSEKIGRVILQEMEKGGNFGQYDSRFTMRNKGFLARGAADIARLFSLAYVFPSECFWKVIEKITNQRWKFKKNSI